MAVSLPAGAPTAIVLPARSASKRADSAGDEAAWPPEGCPDIAATPEVCSLVAGAAATAPGPLGASPASAALGGFSTFENCPSTGMEGDAASWSSALMPGSSSPPLRAVSASPSRSAAQPPARAAAALAVAADRRPPEMVGLAPGLLPDLALDGLGADGASVGEPSRWPSGAGPRVPRGASICAGEGVRDGSIGMRSRDCISARAATGDISWCTCGFDDGVASP
mmetsp:Transcript_8298/g.24861  ORF Transcript_8298/g.24861 Transcript_8298/m.24861 type:complete len:224 (-) Transcript_8298:548-1219(-)